MEAELPQRSDNLVNISVVTRMEQLLQVYAVRGICFVEERELPFRETFDDNDLVATHFLMMADQEPVGASRVRFFADFARIEKTAIRQAYRGDRSLRRFLDFIFAHVARKGYGQIFTTAEDPWAKLWERRYGFRRVPGRSIFKPGGDREYFELVRQLDIPDDAINPRTDPHIQYRTEGAWEIPASSFG